MPFTEKFLRSAPPVEAAGRVIKRYYVTPGGEAMDPEVERAALAILPTLLPDKPDLAAYLADSMPDGLTGRVA